MANIEIGKKAPQFSAPGTGGEWSLKDALGTNVVLYFYPKDNTSGCTEEGKQFSALTAQFKKAHTLIFGISADSLKSHQNFKQKMDYAFELLSDPDRKICSLYDVYKEKSMYGRKYMGIERSTFLVDAKGVLRAEWRKVKVDGHAQSVLTAAKAL
jgi:thioredoxin-dependent peroxiredoxin